MVKSIQGNFKNLTVENIETLRTISGAFPGQTASISGYYVAGDGGGGPDRYRSDVAAPGTYIDNGFSIIVPIGGDGSIAWLWKWAGAVDIRWGGATGSGITDDTAALLSVFSLGGEIYGSAGTYLIDGAGADTGGVQALITKSLRMKCEAGCIFKAGDLDNDMIRFEIPSGGAGLPSEKIIFT